MDSTEAIKWLELLKQKNIEFDDYSEDTKEIREEATRRFQKSLSLGIQALENQKSVIEELEKIKIELFNSAYHNRISGKEQIFVIWEAVEAILNEDISELKGENK